MMTSVLNDGAIVSLLNILSFCTVMVDPAAFVLVTLMVYRVLNPTASDLVSTSVMKFLKSPGDRSNSCTSFSTAILCTFRLFDFVQSNGSVDTVPGCSEKVVVVDAGGFEVDAAAETMICRFGWCCCVLVVTVVTSVNWITALCAEEACENIGTNLVVFQYSGTTVVV